jgi:hypothetical protein
VQDPKASKESPEATKAKMNASGGKRGVNLPGLTKTKSQVIRKPESFKNKSFIT